MKHTLIIACASLALIAASAVYGQDQQQEGAADYSSDRLQELLKVKVRTVETLAFHPRLIAAVKQQNAESLNLTTIQERDTEWSATDGPTMLKRKLQSTSAGWVLKRLVSQNPSFNEAFLTDNQGANVAAFPATSDYWQGDEEKWTASFNEGDGKVFIGPLETDESTQTLAVQISAPVYDRDQTIGVLVVGVTFNYLDAKSL